MTTKHAKAALTTLRWTLGLVILAKAILFLMPSAAQGFSRTHMPGALRLILGWGEIVGAVLMLIPGMAIRGAWLLAAVFMFAIGIHVLHGMYDVGDLLIYAAGAWAVAAGQ